MSWVFFAVCCSSQILQSSTGDNNVQLVFQVFHLHSWSLNSCRTTQIHCYLGQTPKGFHRTCFHVFLFTITMWNLIFHNFQNVSKCLFIGAQDSLSALTHPHYRVQCVRSMPRYSHSVDKQRHVHPRLTWGCSQISPSQQGILLLIYLSSIATPAVLIDAFTTPHFYHQYPSVSINHINKRTWHKSKFSRK